MQRRLEQLLAQPRHLSAIAEQIVITDRDGLISGSDQHDLVVSQSVPIKAALVSLLVAGTACAGGETTAENNLAHLQCLLSSKLGPLLCWRVQHKGRHLLLGAGC